MSAEKKAALRSRVIAGALAVLVLAAAWVDRSSPLAEPVRLGLPLAGFFSARFSGQDPVVFPALYFAALSPRRRSLDLVLVPGQTPIVSSRTLADVYAEALASSASAETAARAAADAAYAELSSREGWPASSGRFYAHFELPKNSRPSYPREIKALVLQGIRRGDFWLRAFSRLPQGMNRYEAYLAAREWRRLKAEAVFMSLLPEEAVWPDFLARIFAGPGELSAPPTVEVLNASPESGVALKATKILRYRGFDVVHFGNSQTPEPAVRALDRVGLPAEARKALDILGCGDADIVTRMEAKPPASLTLVLGRDYGRCRQLAE